MIRIFEYRLRPTRQQEQILRHILSETCALYNNALSEWRLYLDKTGKYLSLYAQSKGYNKTTYPDLPAVVVDQTLDRLHRTLKRYFTLKKEGKSSGFPRYKSLSRWRSIEFRDKKNSLKGMYFCAGKLGGGKIRAVVHRQMEGDFRHARIIARPSGWYLQCICEVGSNPLPLTGRAVGIDVGIINFVSDSDGLVIKHPQCLRKELRSLAHSQRLLSRKKKGSNRFRKQANIISRRYERITNQRNDFLHKLSYYYISNYDTIVVEDLNISGMIRNRSLSRSINDSAWGRFRRMLEYKAEKAGKKCIAVSAHFTSQLCSNCGEYVEKSLSIRTHICPFCGYVDNRDINAAKNILSRALDEGIAERSNKTAMRRETVVYYIQQSVT